MVEFTRCSSCKQKHTRVPDTMEYASMLNSARSVVPDPLNISGLAFSRFQNKPNGGHEGPGTGIS